ncbi:hypothetical protein RRF57_012454 [Xylaria bambusicola]|uniref:Tetraspanin Tsp3 n=1 Tax=Xylaria bambusicola TaxID=326684 RepID=A0AAN7ZAQ5_9PEZI
MNDYVQVTSSTLSLPISTATTVLTILLPLFAIANLFYTPVLNRFAKSSTVRQFMLPALHILQGGLTVVIATLAAQGFTPGPPLECELFNSWQLLYSNHDGRAIERIQNAFDCCGFRKILDRDWPKQQCHTIYDRRTPCEGPWSASMQRTSGLQFAVAVLCGMIQEKLAHLVYFKQRGARDNAAPDYKRRGGRAERAERAERGESGRLIEEAYHDGDDQSPPQSALPAPQITQDDGPRVAPSGLGRDEANEWGSYDE